MKTKIVKEGQNSATMHVLDDKSNIIAIIEIYENLTETVFIDVECVEERVKTQQVGVRCQEK